MYSLASSMRRPASLLAVSMGLFGTQNSILPLPGHPPQRRRLAYIKDVTGGVGLLVHSEVADRF